MENKAICSSIVGHPPNTRVFVILIQLCVHVEYYTINKRRTLSDFQRKQYLVCRTHTTRSLLGSNTDMLFRYQIALWVNEEYETSVGRTHTLSLYISTDVYSFSSRQGACEETAIAKEQLTARKGRSVSASFSKVY